MISPLPNMTTKPTQSVAFAAIASAALAASLAQVASAQAIIINPVSAIESSHDTAFGASVAATINGSGLTGPGEVETGDNPLSGFSGNTHDNSSGNMWRTFNSANGFGAPVDPNAVLTFDLGDVYDLTQIYYWNYNETFESDRGIREVNVSTSANGIDFTTASFLTLAQASGFGGDAGASIAFSAFGARYVRFEVVSNFGDTGLTGLGEVRFVGAVSAVPEPSSYAALLGGVACLAAVARRPRRADAAAPRA